MIYVAIVFLYWFILGLMVGVYHSNMIPMDSVGAAIRWGVFWPILFVLELPYM